MSAVPLVQTLRERQTICTVELLCDNDRENDVAQARAETEPDAGKSVICTVLRAANNHAVADMRAKIRAADDQQTSFFGSSDVFLKVFRCVSSKPSDKEHRSHVYD